MKILIVDDEPLAREAIKNHLNNLGRHETFEAENGLEAYEFIMEHKVDLIIADIKMPEMSGIELLTKLRETDQDTIFVIESGYNDFEYAREALKLGASYYLLKPVAEQEFREVITEASNRLSKKINQRDENAKMKMRLNQGTRLMLRDFIKKLANSEITGYNSIEKRFDELEIEIPSPPFNIVIFSLYGSNSFENDDRNLLKFSLENIATEILQNNGILCFPFDIKEDLGYLLSFENDVSQFPMSFFDICNHIKSSYENFYNCTISVGIGKLVSDIKNINTSYESAKKAFDQRIIKGSQVFFLDENQIVQGKKVQRIINIDEELTFIFIKGDFATAYSLIEDLYNSFANMNYFDTKALLKQNFQLIIGIYKASGVCGINPEALFGDEIDLLNEVNSIQSIDSIKQWFSVILAKCFEHIQIQKEKSNRKIIDIALEYINSNLNSGLTLEIVADYAHLSPNYFSRLFRIQMNETFVDYVLKCRINKAKKLLGEGIYRANEVCAMVGFNNIKYFYQVFKKMTGFTPSEYKEVK